MRTRSWSRCRQSPTARQSPLLERPEIPQRLDRVEPEGGRHSRHIDAHQVARRRPIVVGDGETEHERLRRRGRGGVELGSAGTRVVERDVVAPDLHPGVGRDAAVRVARGGAVQRHPGAGAGVLVGAGVGGGRLVRDHDRRHIDDHQVARRRPIVVGDGETEHERLRRRGRGGVELGSAGTRVVERDVVAPDLHPGVGRDAAVRVARGGAVQRHPGAGAGVLVGAGVGDRRLVRTEKALPHPNGGPLTVLANPLGEHLGLDEPRRLAHPNLLERDVGEAVGRVVDGVGNAGVDPRLVGGVDVAVDEVTER